MDMRDLNTAARLAVTFNVGVDEIRDLFARRGIKPQVVLNGLEYFGSDASKAARAVFGAVSPMEVRSARGRRPLRK